MMSMWKRTIAGGALCLALAGCATDRAPIVAGAIDTVGVSAGAGTQDQGANFVLGYKGAKFAIVPVENKNGELLLIRDSDKETGKQKGFSVFAMLGVDGKGGATPNVGVVQVVAVGPAAETWASRAPVVVLSDQ